MFTKSFDWFDDSKGWKSQQGGLSAIQKITTDANNMGGLFIRKLAGAAVLAVHTQKLIPFLFHPPGAMWNMGHFRPLLCTATIGNILIVALYGLYMDDFSAAGANALPKIFIFALLVETVVVMYYLFTQKPKGRAPSVALPDGKKPTSVTSRIVTRTVIIVSGFLTLIAARDLFFPGQILDFIPRDDIYLEWTGAFLHSPPEGSHEADDQAMASPLYIGDKFVSQIMALHILILCMYKFVTAFFIPYGHDGSGQIKCKMIWKVQAFGDALVVLLVRLFAPAALSASLDLRWHLMAFGYEMFILGMYYYDCSPMRFFHILIVLSVVFTGLYAFS
jgi:hypothetical protein